jgi:GntR family transcriptional regulator
MAAIVIDTRSATPIYAQIVDQVRDRVRAGSLAPGTPLPSVRQLAADLGINPNTVAKAFLLLEREGIVETFPRRGVFVADGARARAAAWIDRRLDDAVNDVLKEATNMGVGREEILAALRRKIGSAGRRRTKTGGRS